MICNSSDLCVYVCPGAVLPAICVVIAGYMGCNQTAATAMFILSMFTMGPFYPGMRVNNMDISKNFAGLVMALENGLGALSFVPAPSIIGVMTPNVKKM